MTSHRVPAGLTVSFFVAAVSIGVMVVLWNLGWPTQPGPPLIAHGCAALCLLWGVCLAIVRPRTAGDPDETFRQDTTSVLTIAMTVAALTAVVTMAFASVSEILSRTLYLDPSVIWNPESRSQTYVWPGGVLDLAIVTAALYLAWHRTHSTTLITVMFWALIFAGLWGSLRVPGWREDLSGGSYRHMVVTPWAVIFMMSSAGILFAFSAMRGLVEQIRRERAWPDALDDLTTPLPLWPGFRYSAGIVASIVLLLGCFLIARPVTVPCAILAGIALLMMSARRWDESLSELGLIIITLAVVSLTMRFLSEPPVGERYKLYVQMFNRVVIGLAVMILFWHWLANVWDQQLDGGRAWTTAGRFIPATRRVGYMLGAIALLVSFQVAFWPKMEFVHDLDDTRGRWIWGLAGHLLLVFALGTSARWTGKQTLAWLTLFAAVAAVSFILVRVPSSPVGQWWTLKWPVATPVIAAIALVLSFLAGRSQTRKMFTDPLLVVGILIAPMSGIMGITFGRQLRIEPWIPYATFFGLTAAYTLAVFLTGPKRLVVLAVLCLGMGIWNFV